VGEEEQPTAKEKREEEKSRHEIPAVSVCTGLCRNAITAPALGRCYLALVAT
jgi:hypothetical protein